ncbi:MBL fold metallo-hydrolase [Streptomyces sp. NPDC046261]|uniref:MBL fold metallo-hydrolase n=1 Tax=Streptomyces sp. NPDC046261 TaxID=3157200 RepID=UPI0034054C74
MCGTCAGLGGQASGTGGAGGADEPGGAQVGRRGLLRGAVAGAAGGLAVGAGLGAAPAQAAPTAGGDVREETRRRRERAAGSGARLRWLGVAGWELSFNGHHILVDPYLSRQEYRVPGGEAIDAKGALRPDAAVVEEVAARHLSGAPELVLVTHGHFDHLLDVPQLLDRGGDWAKATIRTLCGETHRHLLAGMGVSARRLESCVVVSGGEYLRFPAGRDEAPAYTVEVFRSLHSQYGSYGYFAPGTLVSRPARPRTLADLVEGGSLAYQVTLGADGLRVMFLSGTANFAEREVAGARPDVLVLGVSGHTAVHQYVERAMRALGNPPVVVPSHHDSMLTRLTSPGIGSTVDTGAVENLRRIVEPLGSRVLQPRHLRQLEL